jgi:hypothetical protein
MRQSVVLLLSFGALAVFGQTPADSIAGKRLELASQELQRVQKLVEIGAESHVRLEQAEQNVADAQDDVILEPGLYGDIKPNELNDQTIDEMVAAAQRRLDRQQARVDQAKKLVATGLTALSYLTPFEEELSLRQVNLNLAQARAQRMREMIARAKVTESIAPGPIVAQDTAVRKAFPTKYPNFLSKSMEHFEGDGEFNEATDLKPLELAFEKRFDRPLPISAEGETNLHRALGFDHRGRVDVAINPNASEGIWLRHYLQALKIPYYAFTRAIRGKATAAHIHIGLGSTRLLNAD